MVIFYVNVYVDGIDVLCNYQFDYRVLYRWLYLCWLYCILKEVKGLFENYKRILKQEVWS